VSVSKARGTAVAAALITAAAVAAFTAPPATAATASCGSSCTSFYPLSTGTSDVLAVAGASGTSAGTGEPVTIAAASSSNPAEDWFLDQQGTVSDFYQAGLMSAQMNLHWGSDEVYEIDYVPDGSWSGLCLGTSSSNGSGAVSLQPCGATAATLWVADTADRSGRAVPLINGKNNNFSYPYSLTAGNPGDQLTSSELIANSVNPVRASQEWGTIFGEL
jgi:hypothetical protein